ncbi:E3 ubiquitin-protein ligase MIB2-like [Saccostrea cucullata]|uniref:E3 ubiquitin-protein ligase MIB2-like n=1 Tax=Saccostrea cuccullata TaxID=36930 RepID=UPI002ED12528
MYKVKVGQRVVRGKDWPKNNEDDGGIGNVGTVCSIKNDEEVQVQWDSQDEVHQYKTGKDGIYELRLFDNAQSGAIHRYYTCKSCDTFPIQGIKWRCLECNDIDLCTLCYMSKKGNKECKNHSFQRLLDDDSLGFDVGPRRNLDYIAAYGIFPEKEVRYREYPKKKGIRHPVTCTSCDDGELIKGIRWKCSECEKNDLCTKCYMADYDDLEHPYERKEKPNPHTQGQNPTHNDVFRRQNAKKQMAVGILPGSKVVSRKGTGISLL